ncbi:MAG: hypothetical protein QG650_801 [Patescibacteria group bacterium]|nr:hypothetical protein [Patescibacteria group bacterium]
MSGNVIEFPGLNDLERDLLELEVTDYASLMKVRQVRETVDTILGFDYLVELLKRLSRGYPIFPEGYDPVTHRIPHQYAHHFDLLDVRELELFWRWIGVTLDKDDAASMRVRKELFYLRGETIRRMNGRNGVGGFETSAGGR